MAAPAAHRAQWRWSRRSPCSIPHTTLGRCRATITQSLLATQLFVAAAALTSLVLGAVIEERHAALEALREKERRLRDSRARIVKAGDAARRRLERNLHDGAQQRLVSLALRYGWPGSNSKTIRPKPISSCPRHRMSCSAIDELRELARGIHPAVLADRGLGPALEVLAGHAHLPVALETHIPTLLPSTVEAAVYYVAAEGLTNIAKYAHATSATLRLDASNNSVVLRVGITALVAPTRVAAPILHRASGVM